MLGKRLSKLDYEIWKKVFIWTDSIAKKITFRITQNGCLAGQGKVASLK